MGEYHHNPPRKHSIPPMASWIHISPYSTWILCCSYAPKHFRDLKKLMLLIVGTSNYEVIQNTTKALKTTHDRIQGSRDSTLVRALTSHQCVSGSIPGPGVICGFSLLLVFFSAQGGFSPGTPVFASPLKPTFPNSNSILECTGIFSTSSCELLGAPCVNKLHYYYYDCYYYY